MEKEVFDLSLQEKIGQMIIVGMDSNCINERIRNLVCKYKIGGIILYRKNFKTYSEMISLIHELNELNKTNKIPLFIGIDQEGGRVNRMPPDIKNLPAANLIAENGGENLIRDAANITAEMLHKSGYNLNFAPVLDLKTYKDSKAIGDRSFSENKELVAKYGKIVINEFKNQNIIAVAKHFPGHGATKIDSHYMLPIINKSIKQLENEDMYPFEKNIQDGLDAILVGHLLISENIDLYPASLSRKFIFKYIRKKFKYDGLIITDDLKMRAIRLIYGPDLAVKKAFEAGNDLIIFRFKQSEEVKILKKMLERVKKGKIKEARINRSVNRIIKIKKKYQIMENKELEYLDIDEINKKIEKIRESVLEKNNT